MGPGAPRAGGLRVLEVGADCPKMRGQKGSYSISKTSHCKLLWFLSVQFTVAGPSGQLLHIVAGREEAASLIWRTQLPGGEGHAQAPHLLAPSSHAPPRTSTRWSCLGHWRFIDECKTAFGPTCPGYITLSRKGWRVSKTL